MILDEFFFSSSEAHCAMKTVKLDFDFRRAGVQMVQTTCAGGCDLEFRPVEY